jgi:hypothetical protein
MRTAARSPMMPLPVLRVLAAVLPAAAAHNDSTWLAELSHLCVHARRDFSDVGNEIATQLHRIGGTGLSGGVAALCGGGVEAINQYAGQQQQPANPTSDPHL